MNASLAIALPPPAQRDTAQAPVAPARPVKLQANRRGVWCDIAYFNAGDTVAEDWVRKGAEALAAVDVCLSFRVVVASNYGHSGKTLMHYCTRGGWVVK